MLNDKVYHVLPIKIRKMFMESRIEYSYLKEIRIRVNSPILIKYHNEQYTLSENRDIHKEFDRGYVVENTDIREMLEYISRFSLYAFEEEIKQGFITIEGGHRIGVIGQVVLIDGGIKTIHNITFLNIRIAHEIKGCSNIILPVIREKNTIKNTLIISPPSRGKTTLLRDLIRQLSNGDIKNDGFNVGVVDERSEIAACSMGIPQNDVGIRTDVLDNCPKAIGMLMLIRSMSPDIIAIDEIGGKADIDAIEYATYCGCKFIATIHGGNLEELKQKPYISSLIHNKIFERYIVINHVGKIGNIRGIYNEDGALLKEYTTL